MITVQQVSKFLGKKELFQDVTFTIQPGDRIGLIGPNGAGKTTLFSVLMGETEPDTGSVLKSKSARMGWLPQQILPLNGKSVLAHAMDIHDELPVMQAELHSIQNALGEETDQETAKELALRHGRLIENIERLGGYDLEARTRKILAGLGFQDYRLERPVSSLSGGWAMRLELARLLLAAPDFLLLDEPTNHLDLESLLWLEQYLLASSSAMMIISHDRAFLNRVVKRILELEQGRMQEYAGNYDSYVEEKAQRQEIRLASFKNQQDRIKQMERFIERNRYRKAVARQAQSRIKQMEKIERLEAPPGQETVRFTFPQPPRSGKRVLELAGIHKAYGDHVVYSGIDLVVERGNRIALVGPNGAGKSTLLKILAGVDEPTSGDRITGSQTFFGYYAQHQWEQLHSEWTVLEEAASIAGDMPQTQLRGMLGAFLFRGEDVTKKVSVLSGGEKARLTLCKLLLQKPNVLLLDEPTNHLDIPSCDVLEKALEDYEGTVCFISHDRHFINSIASSILLVRDGRLHLFPGTYDDYQNIWQKRVEEGDSAGKGPDAPGEDLGREEIPARKDQTNKRLEAQWRNELYRLKKPVQTRLDRVEAALETAMEEQDALNARMADPATYQNGGAVQELHLECRRCKEQVETLTREWEEAALELEELEKNFWKDKKTA